MTISACPDDWEWNPDFNKCYYYLRVSRTWNKANEKCMELDPEATLTSIQSQEENDYIQSLLASYYSWIGGSDVAKEDNCQQEHRKHFFLVGKYLRFVHYVNCLL